MPTVDGVTTAPGPYNVTEGNGGFRDDMGGGSGNDVLQGEATENYYYGGDGSDTFIIGERYLNTNNAVGSAGQKTVDAIYDFHGAGVYEAGNDDFIAFSGFAAGSTISVITSTSSSSSAEPNAVLYYYSLHDAGTNHDYILAIRSVNGKALTTSDYAFY